MAVEQEYNSILVGIDGSDQARDAFNTAIEVAKRNDAKIVVAHIVEDKDYDMVAMPEAAISSTFETNSLKAVLKEYEDFAHENGVKNIETILSYGSPKQLMARTLPEKYHTDLIMVGQSGLNAIERFMMGSVSSFIIRNAPCDVLVIRPKEQGEKK